MKTKTKAKAAAKKQTKETEAVHAPKVADYERQLIVSDADMERLEHTEPVKWYGEDAETDDAEEPFDDEETED